MKKKIVNHKMPKRAANGKRKAAAPLTFAKVEGLAGLWYLEVCEQGYITREGRVYADLGNGLYLVGNFKEGFDDCPDIMTIRHIDKMKKWSFHLSYEDANGENG